MNKMELGIVAFAVLGTAGLAVMAQLSAPADALIAELPSLEGRSVALECVIYDVRKLDSGSAILSVRDPGNSSLRTSVFIESCSSEFHFGDLVRVSGKVTKYKGTFEISALSDRSVLVIRRADQASALLSDWELADNPGAYLRMTVNLSGTVSDVRDASFVMKSGGCEITVRTTEPENIPEEGAEVSVECRILFDKKCFQYYAGISGAAAG